MILIGLAFKSEMSWYLVKSSERATKSKVSSQGKGFIIRKEWQLRIWKKIRTYIKAIPFGGTPRQFDPNYLSKEDVYSRQQQTVVEQARFESPRCLTYQYSGKLIDPLSANPIKWSNTLKQFVGNLPTNCLSVFDHFAILALKFINKLHKWNFFNKDPLVIPIGNWKQCLSINKGFIFTRRNFKKHPPSGKANTVTQELENINPGSKHLINYKRVQNTLPNILLQCKR